MTKTIFKDRRSLEDVKDKMRGIVSCRQMKDGRVIVARWSRAKKQNKRSEK